MDRLGETRQDGTQCEAGPWDLAGQPDYRLVHAMFLDKVDVGLLLFDPTNRERPLTGVEYWLRHLRSATLRHINAGARVGQVDDFTAPTVLVAARSDRGTPTLTESDLQDFCRQKGISDYVRTSALDNSGVDQLMLAIRKCIPWDKLTATVTTDTFKRIKDRVMRLKEDVVGSGILLTAAELRADLLKSDPGWSFTDSGNAYRSGTSL